MKNKPSDSLFSTAIKAMQQQQGSGEYINSLTERDYWKSQLTDEQVQFIQSRDSFYLATASAKGHPYLQHRGGRSGFITILNSSSLWFPDYRGNRQYISTGNLSENNKAFMFFMDYANQRRLKLWGTALIQPNTSYEINDQQLPVRGQIERIIQFDIKAVDENCRQHIKKRYTENEYNEKLKNATEKIHALTARIKHLEERIDNIEK